MKKLLYFCVVFLFSNLATAAPTGKIPQEVKNYIKNNYPKAKGLHWEKHDGTYIARFVHSNKEMALCLDEKGQVLDRLTEITNHDDIPTNIKDKVDLQGLLHAEKYESRNGELFYLLEVRAPKHQEREMIFDQEGKEINEAMITGAPEESDKVVEF